MHTGQSNGDGSPSELYKNPLKSKPKSMLNKDPEFLQKITTLEDDAEFLRSLIGIHDAFCRHVWDIMRAGGIAKYLYHSIARSLAENHDYIFLCGKIYTPIQFQERLMRILNAQQQKFNQFQDGEKENPKSEQAGEATKEASPSNPDIAESQPQGVGN